MMMRHKCVLLFPLATVSIGWGQGLKPVIKPREVLNAYTLQPAPSIVGRGGLLQLTVLNVGVEGKASGTPLPTQLGDVQVLINGTPAPIFSIESGKILVQVPVDAAVGLAEVVVQKGSDASRPARFVISAMEPSVRSKDGSGYGPVWGAMASGKLTASATGLGATEPALTTGSPASGVAQPAQPVAAFIGGVRTNAAATASTTKVGEFDVQIDVPAAARPGDLVSLVVGPRSANRTVYQPMGLGDMQARLLPLPDDAPELQTVIDTDLNGNYAIAAGARDDSGCYPAVILDFARQKASKISDCLTTGNRNAPVPLAVPNDGDVIGSLIGPPEGEPPAGVSSKVAIFSPAKEAPLMVDLPGAAIALINAGAGNFAAVLPGTPPQFVIVDGQTGEVREGGPAGGGGGGIINIQGLNVDGLTHALSLPVAMGQGRVALIVGDDADQPKIAKFAIVSGSGDAVLTKDFPEGWLPLIAPAPPTRPGGPGGERALLLPRGSAYFDVPTRVFYALARTADDSRNGFVAFTLDRDDPKTVAFPESWFAAACTPFVPLFSLELSRAIALIGSKVPQTELQTPCTGVGFLELDLISQTASAVPLQTQGQVNAGQGASSDINDYVFAASSDGSRGSLPDSVHVLDGVTGSTFTLSLPSGIRGFQALTPLREISSLVGAAMNRRPGDAGMVIFNLDEQTTQLVPVPDGFDSIAEIPGGFFPATRKVVVRGVGQGGAQLFVYDLNTRDLIPIQNPDGVAFVGPRPAAGPGPGGPGGPGGGAQPLNRLLSGNAKANTVAAIALDAEGKQVGVVAVRIP